MSRALTPAADAALRAAHVPLLALVLLEFSGGALRVTNAGYTVRYDGADWLGLGALGQIDAVRESMGLEAHGVTLALSGVPPEHVALALTEHYQGRPATIWMAPLTADHQIVADPVLIWRGRMDTMDIEIGATATITVTAESRLADWARARTRRYNDADQQIDHPGDRGFQFAAVSAAKALKWGAS